MPDRIFQVDGFRVDAARRCLSGKDGAPVELPSRAFDLLLYMVERPGEMLEKSALLKAVWPTTVVEESNLSQSIFLLRKALGDTASQPRFIATVPGRGYQFVAAVRPVAERRSSAAVAPVAPAQASTAPRSRRRLWGLAAAAMLALVAIGYLLWSRDTPAPAVAAPAPAAPAVTLKSIAVLPFGDLTSTGDMEYFASGIAEELMDSLAASGKVRVVGRRSTIAFKERSIDPLQIGKILDADAVLEGSVHTEGDRIQISAWLVRTEDGSAIWSRTFERAFDDVLDIQSVIAREVSAAVAPPTDMGAGTRAAATRDTQQTGNPEAYRAFLRGIYYFGRETHVDMPVARDQFLRATQLDPNFARAHAWLGRSSAWLARRSLGSIEQNMAVASAAIERAIQLDPSLGNIWWMQTHGSEDDYSPFTIRAHTFEQALATNPGDADVMLWLGLAYQLQGRRAEALELYDRAHEADPAWSQGTWVDAYYLHRFGNDRPRVLKLTDEMEALSASDPRPYTIRALIALAEGRAIDWDRWNALAIKAAPRDQPLHGYLSLDYTHLGILDAALYHGRICNDLNPESAAGLYNESHILLHSGDIPAARAIVQKARREKSADYLTQLAQAELLYFTGDCAGSIDSMLLARPAFGKPPASLDLIIDTDDLPILVWCLRQQGRTTRVDEIMRVFDVQFAPPLDEGGNGGLLARMAAAHGDRENLLKHLDGLVKANSMVFAFARHEPMIQPYLGDPAVAARLDKLEARRAEWRRIVPKTSMRVPVPAAPKAAGS